MKTNSILTAITLATALIGTAAFADSASSTVSANSPAPAVQAPPAAPAPNAIPMPAPNQIIYLPQLPTPASLVNVASAQGVSIEQISQTSSQIIVTYKYGNGQTNTICYQLLSTAGTAPVAAASTPVVVPQTTVIYGQPAPAYYYNYYDDPFYTPWPWFGPVGIGFGFEFHGGHDGGFHGDHDRDFHGGGFRGGFHGRHGWR